LYSWAVQGDQITLWKSCPKLWGTSLLSKKNSKSNNHPWAKISTIRSPCTELSAFALPHNQQIFFRPKNDTIRLLDVWFLWHTYIEWSVQPGFVITSSLF
jgi:hypothetical protein